MIGERQTNRPDCDSSRGYTLFSLVMTKNVLNCPLPLLSVLVQKEKK
jgi:hypothetical protein